MHHNTPTKKVHNPMLNHHIWLINVHHDSLISQVIPWLSNGQRSRWGSSQEMIVPLPSGYD